LRRKMHLQGRHSCFARWGVKYIFRGGIHVLPVEA